MKAHPECILDEAGIAAAVEDLADRLMPLVDDDTVAVCLLSGGLWFTADLTRALARRGRHLCYDGLWLSSYGDAHESSGRVDVYAPLQRSVIGRTVLLLDDVLDSGRSILKAKALLLEAGAAHVITTVFARKPWPEARAAEADYVAVELPARYLVGYGLDSGGRWRTLPWIGALD